METSYTECGLMYEDTLVCEDAIMDVGDSGYVYRVGTIGVAKFKAGKYDPSDYWQIIFDLGVGWTSFCASGPAEVECLEEWIPILDAVEDMAGDPEFAGVAKEDGVVWCIDWCEEARELLQLAAAEALLDDVRKRQEAG